MIRRLLDDFRFRRDHKRSARDDGVRLVSLVDDPFLPWSDDLFLTYNGYRPWCDGKRKACPCGDRCCECRHTERRS